MENQSKQPAEKNKGGRPSKFNEDKHCQMALDYLAEHQDSEREIIKETNDGATVITGTKLVVKLPTIRGFAAYCEVDETTVYDWAKKSKAFSQSLANIKREQEERVLNKGASGEYNPTIAKLILSANHGYSEKQEIKQDTHLSGSISVEKEQAIDDALNNI